MTPSIYINLEDDVSAIATRLKRERAAQIILVCPKRCFLFSDPINLKLLKKQADLLGKEIFVLTMDEKGRGYAQAAGFGLHSLPKTGAFRTISDINVSVKEPDEQIAPAEPAASDLGILSSTVGEVKKIAKLFTPAKSEPELILPPLVASSEVLPPGQPLLPDAQVKDAIFPKELDNIFSQQENKQKKKKSKRKLGLAVFILAAALAFALFFLVLPKATVVVYPKTESVIRDMDISIGTAIAAPDPSKLVLPAVKVDEVLQASDKFQSQGKKEVGNKAQGTVVIYNFTKLPVKLKSATTVLALGDKTYTLVDDLVQIRPTVYKNAKTKEIDPSSLEAPFAVQATEGGEASNVPAGTRLEITNQVFGSKPLLLYAKTQTPIEGGVSRYLSVVTNQDISLAQASLQQTLMSQLGSKLASSSLDLLDNGYSVQVNNFATDKPVDSESPTFTASLSIHVTGLAFQKPAMAKLITDRILQTVPNDETLNSDDNLSGTYKIKSVDLNAGVGVVSAHFDAQAISKVDTGGLGYQLAGKTEDQVDDILKAKSSIDRIDVTLAPAWQKTFPWLVSKIDIKIQN